MSAFHLLNLKIEAGHGKNVAAEMFYVVHASDLAIKSQLHVGKTSVMFNPLNFYRDLRKVWDCFVSHY